MQADDGGGGGDDKLHILLFFSRHSERADKKVGTPKFSDLITCDPYLTEEGKDLAIQVGNKMYSYVAESKTNSYLPLL